MSRPPQPAPNPPQSDKFLELRKEVLDIRSAQLNRWMTAMSIGLAFILGAFGFFGSDRLERFESQLSDIRDRAESDANEIRKMRRQGAQHLLSLANATSRGLSDQEADELRTQANAVFEDITSDFLDRMIAQAVAHEIDANLPAAIALWRSIAEAARPTDSELSARAWYSVGRTSEQSCRSGDRPTATCSADAIAAFGLAIALKPTWAEAYNRRANLLSEVDRHQEAIADIDKALALKPDSLAYIWNRASFKVDSGSQDAITDFDRAVHLAPNDYELRLERGAANIRLGRIDAARQDYEIAIGIAGEQGMPSIPTIDELLPPR